MESSKCISLWVVYGLYSVCFVRMVFLLVFSLGRLFLGLYFVFYDYSVFVDWEFLMINGRSVVITLLFDWVSLIFLSFVLFISSIVVMYSRGYIFGDYNVNRFVLIVLLFVASMCFVILSPNLISILLGWDGLGLVSYCLIIYYQNFRSSYAGMLTALSNRIGDVAILLGIGFMSCMGRWEFPFYYFESFSFEIGLVAFFAVLAGMTRSAQIPFSAWLPAAIAAPTPVSALVHSSTLVTAGVYLIIRFYPYIEGRVLQSFLLFISCFTMFMAGLGANFETDLKKIIALSTLSQLGVMLFSLSLGCVGLAFFHLLTHALFKSLLFLCAGSIIHSVGGTQDLRSMGGLSFFMPLTVSCFNVSNLALCGIPFLAGFYSKDLIIEMCMGSWVRWFIFIVLIISTGFTVCYSFRLAYISVIGIYLSLVCGFIGDEDCVMTWPMIFLTCFSCIGGCIVSWFVIPFSDLAVLPFFLRISILFVVFFGGLAGVFLGSWSVLGSKSFYYIFYFISFFSGGIWFMPYLSTRYSVFLPLYLGELYYRVGDHGWLEYFGGQGIYRGISFYSSRLQHAHDNLINVYLYTFLFWVLVVFVLSL